MPMLEAQAIAEAIVTHAQKIESAGDSISKALDNLADAIRGSDNQSQVAEQIKNLNETVFSFVSQR